MPDELNGTTGTEQATKQVEIPECLRDLCGQYRFSTQIPPNESSIPWLFSLGWQVDNGWYIEWYKEEVDSSSRLHPHAYLHLLSNGVFTEAPKLEGATFFPTKETAMKAFENARPTFGWLPPRYRKQEKLWIESQCPMTGYLLDQQDDGLWIVSIADVAPLAYLAHQQLGEGCSFKWVSVSCVESDRVQEEGHRFPTLIEAVEALRNTAGTDDWPVLKGLDPPVIDLPPAKPFYPIGNALRQSDESG